MQEELAADFPAVPDYRAELAEMLLSSFRRFSQLKAPKEAEERFGRAVALADELVAKNPAVPDYQALQARAKGRLGSARRCWTTEATTRSSTCARRSSSPTC